MNPPRTRTPIRRLSLLFAVAVLMACGGGTEALFVPFFTFGFQDNLANPTLNMSLKPGDDCSSKGTLPGSANMDVFNEGTAALTGTYDGRDLSITLSQPLGDYQGTYSGHFVDRDNISFKPAPGGTGKPFTVTRNSKGQALPSCP
jgi:hypothetical protein